MSKTVKMKSFDGVTLNTKGKIVDDNIKIVPELPVYKGEAENVRYSEVDSILSRKIVSYSNTSLTTLGSYAFAGCSQLAEVYLPKVEVVSPYSFQGTKIKILHLPKVKTIGSNGIYLNSYLKELYLDSVGGLASGAIRGSVQLIKLVIGNKNKVCTVEASNAFAECYHLSGTVHNTYNPEGLKDGLIYVPDHLIEDYKVAQYWSVFADQFRPLSELEEA